MLALAGGLSVELPLERAHELLRPLASEADMSRVQQTLSAVHVVSGDPSWRSSRSESSRVNSRRFVSSTPPPTAPASGSRS